jgi:hypothetical protein
LYPSWSIDTWATARSPAAIASAFAALVGEREPPQRVALRLVGRRGELRVYRHHRRVGVGARSHGVAAQAPGLGQHQPPVSPVVVEGARRQPQQQLLVGVVERPEEVPIVAE